MLADNIFTWGKARTNVQASRCQLGHYPSRPTIATRATVDDPSPSRARCPDVGRIVREMSQAVPIPLIASGGAGTLEHIRQVFADGAADAALAASIFHFGRYTIPEAKK